MITPTNTYQTPNAVYASNISVGMSIINGKPVGVINNLTLQSAYVDPNGVWSVCGHQGVLNGLRFSFDNSGNITGLPTDLQSLAPQILTAWTDLVAVAGGINTIRKLV